MSKSTGTPIKSTSAGPQSPPLEQPSGTSYSSQTSSSGGSSLYSTSSSSSRQHLSSGNTSPPGILPVSSSSVGDREQNYQTSSGGSGPSEEKLHFSPATRGIIQQSLEAEQFTSSEWSSFKSQKQQHRSDNNSTSGSGSGSGTGRYLVDPIMQSALIPSAAATSSSSSAAQRPHQQNQHPPHTLRDESRGSALRQYSEEGKSSSSYITTNGHSNGQQRPASKARRTSSGGSRVPGKEVRQNSGYGGSSASDSGSDWPHGPKTHVPVALATSSPNEVLARTKTSETDSPSTNTAAASGSNSSTLGGHKRPERASTSSSYFTRAAAVAAAASKSGKDSQSLDLQDASHPHLDLAKYPPQDLLRVLAALLAQIAAANDQLRPNGGNGEEGQSRRKDQTSGQESSVTASSSNGSVASQRRGRSEGVKSNSATSSPGQLVRPTTAAMSALTTPSSTLCFHARNVPSISIESYLLRILKYCPATNEVFLSLLIYFDRMSKMGALSSSSSSSSSASTSMVKSTSATLALEDEKSADDDEQLGHGEEDEEGSGEGHAGMRGFAIDSYNVHRLVIAGVTVASKFFSDVFYTNSRYAKVGGLPVHELNQLELQFLLLNDFKLVIPLEEMQRYADQLLVYGGVPRSTWSEPTDSLVSDEASQGSDRTASEAFSRHQQDIPMQDA